MSSIENTLKFKIKNAPENPGCYMFKDRTNLIIYVGKAKMIRTRVQSYFRASIKNEKIRELMKQVVDVDFFVTETETDALLNEYRLIKQHAPHFNSQLNENVPHPLIRLDTRSRYASLSIVYERESDKSLRYFDCFYDEQNAKDCLSLLNQVWKTPACGQSDFSKSKRPCLNYHMDACFAPCTGMADEQVYSAAINDIIRLFDNKRVEKIKQMKQEMLSYSKSQEYEKAGKLNQLLDSLYRLQRKGRKMFNFPKNKAVLVLLRAYNENSFSMYFVKNGLVYVEQRFFPESRDYDIAQFAEMAVTASEPKPTWLSNAILEIHADKLFKILPEKWSPAQLKLLIEAQCDVFST
jgi:excinuclease ABC subunit C